MAALIVGQIVPLLVVLVRLPDAVLPLLQPAALAVRPNLQRAKEVVALAQVLVPDGQLHGLLVQLVRSRLEHKLLVVHRIQGAPLDARFALLVAMGVRLDLAAGWENATNACEIIFNTFE